MSLEIGTAETTIVDNKKPKNLIGLSGGKGSGGSKNRGGGNGGGGSNGGDGGNGGGLNNDYLGDTARYKSDKFRIGMWFLLLVVLMTFGGLIGTYIMSATNKALEWKPFDLPAQIWISTVLIFLSSVTYSFAQRALNHENQTKAKNWLLATTVLGAMFISSQVLSWVTLVNAGVYMASNPFAGFFYILTAVHALHIGGGICALGYIVLRIWNQTDSETELAKRRSVSSVVGWYWHFMGALWAVLFLLLGFWK